MIKLCIKKELLGPYDKMLLDVNLDVEKESFIAIYGQSGSGKTTLLRIMAGLEEALGEIVVDGAIWLDSTKKLASEKRSIGFVFQDYALFENMSVKQNLLYVQNDKKLAYTLLQLTQLTQLQNRYPKSLSGGQKQRVALCRAFMKRPKLLLMDEPLSALDPKMRAKLQEDIKTLHKTFKTTTIMVSHDPSEIYRLAQKVIVLDQGKIIRECTAKELFLKTKDSHKFALLGELLELIKADVIYIAVVAVGQQIIKVIIDTNEAKDLNIGDTVKIDIKAFSPFLDKVKSNDTTIWHGNPLSQC